MTTLLSSARLSSSVQEATWVKARWKYLAFEDLSSSDESQLTLEFNNICKKFLGAPYERCFILSADAGIRGTGGPSDESTMQHVYDTCPDYEKDLGENFTYKIIHDKKMGTLLVGNPTYASCFCLSAHPQVGLPQG